MFTVSPGTKNFTLLAACCLVHYYYYFAYRPGRRCCRLCYYYFTSFASVSCGHGCYCCAAAGARTPTDAPQADRQTQKFERKWSIFSLRNNKQQDFTCCVHAFIIIIQERALLEIPSYFHAFVFLFPVLFAICVDVWTSSVDGVFFCLIFLKKLNFVQ